jgi:aspartyl-tRNA(Asn)/glutamyl-tRNA(Gln) amidotransferase subunit A
MSPPTLDTLARDLAQGRVTSTQLAAAALARIGDAAGEGARAFIRTDPERALAAARASDALRAAGVVRSPLEGIPVSVKDLFDLAGQVTLAGSVALKGAPPAARNAPVVDRLLAAGAVIVGGTNMSEFAFSGLGINPHHGTPRNPWGRAADGGGRIPGGSSSGAAVSVTDGMAALAIGTDTGGSVRIPAALCGLAGFKPTARRVTTQGALPLSTTLDSIGPIAACVRDCAIADAVLAGEDIAAAQTLAPRPLDGARLLVPATLMLDGIDATVAAAFDRACAVLSRAGARITRAPVPELAELPSINARGTLLAAEAWHWHRGLIARQGAAYDPRVRARIEAGAAMSAADYLDLIAARQRWIATLEQRLAPHDALIAPTTPIIAPDIAATAADDATYFCLNGLMLRNTSPINFLDGCGLSIPCHEPGSAPVGLMLAGPALSDHRILALGLAMEAALQAVPPGA